MRLALYQPEIPQNTGTLLRLGACLRVGIDIIEPCGFVFSDRRIKRSGMDYIEYVDLKRHQSWEAFRASLNNERLVLLTPDGSVAHTDFAFQATDILMVGRESNGVPTEVREATHAQIHIPMRTVCRSLNVAIAAAIVLGEALRQTALFSKDHLP